MIESTRQFSEVTEAFIANAANLNEARHSFERETRQFNDLVLEHLREVSSRDYTDDNIEIDFRWDRARDWSSAREVAWLNFGSGSKIELDLRTPDRKYFVKSCASLFFEIVFDWDLSRFIYRSRFENHNQIPGSEQLDEIIYEIVSDRPKEFPDAVHYKRSTTYLFQREINNGLFLDYGNYIDDCIRVCNKAIIRIFSGSTA